MSSSPCDTLAGVKRLTEAGMPQAQAEAVIHETAQIIFDRMATKYEVAQGLADLQHKIDDVEARLQAQIVALRQHVDAENKVREYRMLIEIAGVVATLLAVFGAVMKYLQ